MTTIHFSLDLPLPAAAPRTVVWKHDRPLRLDGHALGGTPPRDQRLLFAPVSIALHAVVLTAFVLGPLLGDPRLPEPAVGVRAFFAEPSSLVAPPPPPPPPAAAARTTARKTPPPPVDHSRAFVAPVEVPDRIAPSSLSVGGGGVPGGVEGGVEGGVAGGIVGGLPSVLPPPPPPRAPVVRVGGDIREPARIVYVAPEYPAIAVQGGIKAIVIIEAQVGTDGRVKQATVLRGHPLFDESALAAVRQWRYQPLLLNGVPTDFVLSVTVRFLLRPPPVPDHSL